MCHLVDELIHVLVLDVLLLGFHDIGYVLVKHIHSFFLSHKSLHSLGIVLALHFIAGPTHDLGHAGHHILHGLIDCHLLKST